MDWKHEIKDQEWRIHSGCWVGQVTTSHHDNRDRRKKGCWFMWTVDHESVLNEHRGIEGGPFPVHAMGRTLDAATAMRQVEIVIERLAKAFPDKLEIVSLMPSPIPEARPS